MEGATNFANKHRIGRAYGSYEELVNDEDVQVRGSEQQSQRSDELKTKSLVTKTHALVLPHNPPPSVTNFIILIPHNPNPFLHRIYSIISDCLRRECARIQARGREARSKRR